jgi:diacylglycerol kinase family enzyme
MRVSLFHNQRAGDNTSLSFIRELIETSGHEVVRVFDREAAFGELIDERTELVVAAGGDGTVSAAARLLAGKPIPLTVLPLGTANNIAKTLQGEASSEELIARWNTASRRRVDMGVAHGMWGERRFLEAVGVGLVPVSIASTLTEPLSGQDARANVRNAVVRYGDVLAELKPRRWTVRVDEEEVTGDFILLEVLNIRSVGPNLVLYEDADPSDGYFNVVIATDKHRDEIARYIQERIDGREGRLCLPSLRGQRVDIHGRGDTHVDDELVRSAIPGTATIQLEPAAVEFLVP